MGCKRLRTRRRRGRFRKRKTRRRRGRFRKRKTRRRRGGFRKRKTRRRRGGFRKLKTRRCRGGFRKRLRRRSQRGGAAEAAEAAATDDMAWQNGLTKEEKERVERWKKAGQKSVFLYAKKGNYTPEAMKNFMKFFF